MLTSTARHSKHLAHLFVLGLLLVGCAHPSRVAFSRDFSCPIKEVRTRPLYAGAYEVSGCGKSVGYRCPNGSAHNACTQAQFVVQRRAKKDRELSLRRRFEADTGCSARHARVARTTSGAFVVTGCEYERSYVCSGDEVCEPTP